MNDPSMHPWPSLRRLLLGTTLASVLLTLGWTIATPKAPTSLSQPDLPTHLPLPNWQALPSQPLTTPTAPIPTLTGRQYLYRQGKTLLTIEMRYLVHSYVDIATLVRQSPGVSQRSPLVLQEHPDIGFYSLAHDSQRAYLQACITPTGRTTVTGQQFQQNQNTPTLLSRRLLPWILGQQELRDWRCLLTSLSLPLNATSGSTPHDQLIGLWPTWYQQWRDRFQR